MAHQRTARPELLALAARVKDARLALGWSLGHAARAIGTSATALNRWEQARTTPIHRTLQAMSRVYGISWDEIYELTNRPKRKNDLNIIVQPVVLHPALVGARVRAARLGLPHRPAAYLCARAAKVATITWTLLEAGLRLPKPEILDRIALIIEIDPGNLRTLAGYAGAAPPPPPKLGTLGQEIRTARTRKGLSTTLCAYRARVAHETLQALEAGTREVTPEVLGRLADILDISRGKLHSLAGHESDISVDPWLGIAFRADRYPPAPGGRPDAAGAQGEHLRGTPGAKALDMRGPGPRGSWDPPYPLSQEFRP